MDKIINYSEKFLDPLVDLVQSARASIRIFVTARKSSFDPEDLKDKLGSQAVFRLGFDLDACRQLRSPIGYKEFEAWTTPVESYSAFL